MKPEILVMNQRQAEAYSPGEAAICISIVTPGEDPADLEEGWDSVLRLQFHDVQDRGVAPISRKQAREVVDFVWGNRDAVRLIVHCEAGVSRSAGVALAAKEILDGTVPPRLEKRFSLHNKLVRRRVLQAWRAP